VTVTIAKLFSMLRLRLEANPILVREVRARWRKWPPFALAFGYAVALALVAGWVYAVSAARAASLTGEYAQRSATLGKMMFVQLSGIQLIGWLLLAPILTATSITSERERGLLDGLQLTHLEPQEIVRGKLLSALAFIVLLLLVPLPVAALCFQMGGVAPGEFFQVFLLHAVTATACAAIGLAWSARCQRSGIALCGALITSCCFGLMPPFSPMMASYAVFAASGRNLSGVLGWATSLLFQDMLILYCVRFTAEAMLRPLPARPAEPDMSGHPVLVVAESLVARPIAQRSPHSSSPHSGSPPKRLEMPLAHLLQFANPVLQREVRTKLRLRYWMLNLPEEDVPGCLAIFGLLFVFVALLVLKSQLERPSASLEYLFFFWLILVAPAAAIMGATSFTREREAHMLEPILLASLSPHEILLGKLCGALVACGYYSLALLPFIAPHVLHNIGALTYNSRVPLLQTLGAVLIVTATAWCYTSWGLFISWLCRSTWVATAITLSTLLLALLAVPALLANTLGDQTTQGILGFWHPFAALDALATLDNPRTAYPAWKTTIWFVLTLVFTGCVALLILKFLMRHGPRQPDRVRGGDKAKGTRGN